jgi:hypothetical protein
VTWWAYVDESMRQRRDGSGIYVLAAAVLDAENADTVRHSLLAFRHRRRPLHWRLEEPADQRKAVAAVAELDCLHVIVIGVRLDLKRQERGRRHCLKELLWMLQDHGVERVWLDSRTPALNRRDLELVQILRGYGTISDRLRVEFAKPFNGRDGEVLLWLPDVVAGAAGMAHGENNDEYLIPLEKLITKRFIELN